MFKDYYEILGIELGATPQEIKSAYRNMSKKWHPDKNPNLDVKEIMQDINEAYTILKKETSRQRYDVEYKNFKEKIKQYTSYNNASSNNDKTYNYNYDYNIYDETLKQDINYAREQAKKLVKEFLESFHNTSKQAAKGAWDEAKSYIIGGILATLIFALIRNCN